MPRDQLSILAGAGHLVPSDTSAEVRRWFCGRCGCQLLLDDTRWPHLKWYTPGTCDGHPGHPVGSEKHIFVGPMLAWYHLSDGLPQRETF